MRAVGPSTGPPRHRLRAFFDIEPPGAACFRHACAPRAAGTKKKAWHATRHRCRALLHNHTSTASHRTCQQGNAQEPCNPLGASARVLVAAGPSRVTQPHAITATTCTLWQQTTHTLPHIQQQTKHTTLSPRAGSREDFLLLDTRGMELYYHHYEHSTLIPGHRTRAYDWCSSNMGLGFMNSFFFLDWHCFFFTLLFECQRCWERRSHTDMSSDIEKHLSGRRSAKKVFACARIPTENYDWNGGRNRQDLTTYTHTNIHSPTTLPSSSSWGLMASKEAYVGLWHGISKQISNCTMKTLLHKHHSLFPIYYFLCDASDDDSLFPLTRPDTCDPSGGPPTEGQPAAFPLRRIPPLADGLHVPPLPIHSITSTSGPHGSDP